MKTDLSQPVSAIGKSMDGVLIFKGLGVAMMNVKSLKTGLLTCALLALGGAEIAHAKSPVVVEMYGRNECGADTLAQDDVLDILQDNDNVIFINCRRLYDRAEDDHRYTLELCNERTKKYNQKFGYMGIKTPMVVVNGKWDAFNGNIAPAVKLGQSDPVEEIKLSLTDGNINIEIPAIESKAKSGSLFLYGYLPTQGKKKILIDPDVELTPALEEKIRLKQSVPFVQETHVSNFYLRPVLSRERIGQWSGDKISMSYPLTNMQAIAGNRHQDLSYVVVLHQGGDYGSIIAAGEVISKTELVASLPKSAPLDIQRSSMPNPAMTTQ